MPTTPVGKIFKPRLREIAAEGAARELIAAALPDAEVEIRAVTDPDRGLLVRAKAETAVHKALRAELERLPLAVEITGT
jgi:fatty-acyl-CoA synthase